MSITAKDLTEKVALPLWNDKTLEVVDAFFTPNADIRTTFLSGTGPTILKQSVQATFNAFPYFESKIEDMLQQGSKVTYKWHAKARSKCEDDREVIVTGIVYGEIKAGLVDVYHSYSNIHQIINATYKPLYSPQETALLVKLGDRAETPLTNRELQCLSAWLKGYSIKETAKSCGGISPKTVQCFRESIKQKLKVVNYRQLLSLIQQIN